MPPGQGLDNPLSSWLGRGFISGPGKQPHQRPSPKLDSVKYAVIAGLRSISHVITVEPADLARIGSQSETAGIPPHLALSQALLQASNRSSILVSV